MNLTFSFFTIFWFKDFLKHFRKIFVQLYITATPSKKINLIIYVCFSIFLAVTMQDKAPLDLPKQLSYYPSYCIFISLHPMPPLFSGHSEQALDYINSFVIFFKFRPITNSGWCNLKLGGKENKDLFATEASFSASRLRKVIDLSFSH